MGRRPSCISPGFFALLSLSLDLAALEAAQDPLEAILARITPPEIPARDVIVPPSAGNARAAINQAIESCHNSGGGRVVLPAGTWLSAGPIEFKSSVELHLKRGATLRFSTTPTDYLPMVLTKFEGTLLYNYSPLIRAYEVTNVALTGEPGSVIDGQGQEGFSKWRAHQTNDQDALRKMGNDTVPHYQRLFGPDHYLRPVFVQFFGCTNVLVEGVTLIDSPFWVVHPTFSTNVIVRGITVNSPHVNNDGVDPDSCVDVLIERNNITSGDDCIAIKSGRDADSWQMGQPTQNVVVRGNICNGPGNGICVGSEMSGGVENVLAMNNTMVDVGSAIYFKSNLDRGAWVTDIVFDGVTVAHSSECISFTNNYHGARGGDFPTLFRNYSLSNVLCVSVSGTALSVDGLPQMPIADVRLTNVTVSQARRATSFNNTRRFVFDNVKVRECLFQK